MNIWTKISELLQIKTHVFLLTVVESYGSAPGRRGYKMLVADNGELFGSIGGGIMEFNMVEHARKKLSENQRDVEIIRQVHRENDNDSSGMICSGSQTIAFNLLTVDDLELINQCRDKRLVIELSNKGFNINNKEINDIFKVFSTSEWVYTETINHCQRVHIFGAGHVSVPTSEILMRLGFEVHLYDNRKNINTFAENIHISSKRNVNYNDIRSSLSIDKNDHVLIMTHKYTEDRTLLSQFFDIECKYLGVLGSRSKIKKLLKDLTIEACDKRWSKRLHSPVGLDINSRTPEEIAVSIAAEIISVKNKDK